MNNNKMKKYSSSIINFLNNNPKHIYKGRQITKCLNVPNKDYQSFKRLFRLLAEEGKIQRYKGNQYGKIKVENIVTGILHVKTEGFGYLIRDDHNEDIFISQRNMGPAMHRDRIKVIIWAHPKGKSPEGRVLQVIEKKYKKIVGTYTAGNRIHYVIPDDLKISQDLLIPALESGGAAAGQKVVVEVINRKDSREPLQGRVTAVLGNPEEEDVDILSIIHSLQLPIDFPKTVIYEADQLAEKIPEAEYKRRLDLRDNLIFTIDPEDAKDFDDAVSLQKKQNGNYLLGVHIADVSFWVKTDSIVDREALDRGTSIYLIDRVIPMLPESLSNKICSLRPDEDRLTYSVLMELSPQGEVVDYEFRESIIKSRYKLSYLQVQKIINESKENKPDILRVNHEYGQDTAKEELYNYLKKTISEMYNFSQIITSRFRANGAIDFDTPEPKILLDSKGRPVDIKIRERLDSHKLIECFMLLANKTVAEHIQKLREEKNNKFPFIYRIHEKPQPEKISTLSKFVRTLGYDFNVGKKIKQKKIQSLLKQVKGTKHEYLIEGITLRSMMKAEYSKKNPGHFGLGFPHYTHFTSPIRRYPDLIIHRLLKAYCSDGKDRSVTNKNLTEICKIANQKEIIAQEAERESIKAKQILFLKDKIGEQFNGVISGVVSFGIFVEISEFLIDGLVHIKDLNDDYYIHDEGHYCLIGQRRGKTFRIGDTVRVRLKKVLLQMRKIDFDIVN